MMVPVEVTENSLEQLVNPKCTVVFLIYDVVSVGLVCKTKMDV